MKTLKFLSYILCALLLVSACKEDEQNPGQSYLELRMSDAPGNYTAVNIDLKAVEITNEVGEKYLADVKAGQYNLIELTNGKDALIANGLLKGGKISKIRLILGIDNSVVVGTSRFPLNTDAAEEGLTISINEDIVNGYNVISLDFDASQSIKQNGMEYMLKPVIRKIDVENTGAIKGRIKQHSAVAVVTATGAGGTFTTYTSVGDCDHQHWHGHGHHGYIDLNWDGWNDENDEGNGDFSHPHKHNAFFLSGIPAGTYTVTVVGTDPYTTTVTLNNVVVKAEEVTNVGKIHL